MKTKKELLKRIKELEVLLKQKDDLINMLNTQYQNNVPDKIIFGCQHEWVYSDNSTARQTRHCRKCGIWETIPQSPPYMVSPTVPQPPFIVGDDPNKEIKVGD